MAKNWAFAAFILYATLLACSKDDDNKITNKIPDVGEKWRISSVDYNIVEQSTSGIKYSSGTLENAGAFYFDGATGTFDILIKTWHEEDYFSFTENGSDINITTITQSAGLNHVSQSVIVISGSKDSETTMTIDGTITRQSTGGQFVLTATFKLVKE